MGLVMKSNRNESTSANMKSRSQSSLVMAPRNDFKSSHLYHIEVESGISTGVVRCETSQATKTVGGPLLP